MIDNSEYEMLIRRYNHKKLLLLDLDNKLQKKYNVLIHNQAIKIKSDMITINRKIALLHEKNIF